MPPREKQRVSTVQLEQSTQARSLPIVSGHQDALDGVRATAAFAVLLFHVASGTGYISDTRKDALAWLLSRGEMGVPIFFTLSGLLLYLPWARTALDDRPAPRTGRYLWKRALRLLPAYWVLVALTQFTYGRAHVGDLWGWVKLLTLTYSYDPHNWWLGFLGPKGLGQIWSLTVEAAFYLTLPLTAAALAAYARRGGDDPDARGRRLLTGIGFYAAISLAYTVVMFHSSQGALLGMWLPRYFAWFAVGMALAVLSAWARAVPAGSAARFCRTVGQSWGACWLIAALIYCVASTPVTGKSRLVADSIWTSQFNILLYGLVAAFFVAPVALAAQAHPAMTAILGNRVMRFLGKISYGVFLWQFVVMFTWFDVSGHPPFTGNLLVDFPITALLTVGVATVSYYLVEEPVRKLGLR
jgi:peptidoglycan/LPS O-acetylase OafA/YrhL